VEAVIENLTYRNPDSDPNCDPKVSVVVSDGDGGQSARAPSTSMCTHIDGSVRLLGDDQQSQYYTAATRHYR